MCYEDERFMSVCVFITICLYFSGSISSTDSQDDDNGSTLSEKVIFIFCDNWGDEALTYVITVGVAKFSLF